MATITGLTAERMLAIEGASVVDGDVVNGDLILTKHDGSSINAGSVIGPVGPQGPQGLGPIPGEIKMWSGAALPDPALYGTWVWANGAIYDAATHPIAAAHIDPAWKTAHGSPDPGAGKFRVPDMRGYVPAGLDAMPVGSPRANHVTRAEAIGIAKITGEEKHVLIIAEHASHTHPFRGNAMPGHGHGASFAGNGLPVHYHPMTANQNGVNKDMKWDKFTAGSAGTQDIVRDVGGMSGAATGTAHAVNTGTASAGTPSGSVSVIGASAGTPSGTVDPSGSGNSHENMQPTVFVPYIVKLDD